MFKVSDLSNFMATQAVIESKMIQEWKNLIDFRKL
jgi:hypothetical protein